MNRSIVSRDGILLLLRFGILNCSTARVQHRGRGEVKRQCVS
jgi:hypothetical protein